MRVGLQRADPVAAPDAEPRSALPSRRTLLPQLAVGEPPVVEDQDLLVGKHLGREC